MFTPLVLNRYKSSEQEKSNGRRKKKISTYVWSRFTINILSGVTIKVSFNSIVNKIEGLICKRGIMERISGPYLEENCSADWP